MRETYLCSNLSHPAPQTHPYFVSVNVIDVLPVTWQKFNWQNYRKQAERQMIYASAPTETFNGLPQSVIFYPFHIPQVQIN